MPGKIVLLLKAECTFLCTKFTKKGFKDVIYKFLARTKRRGLMNSHGTIDNGDKVKGCEILIRNHQITHYQKRPLLEK